MEPCPLPVQAHIDESQIWHRHHHETSHKVDITAEWSILVLPCTIYNLATDVQCYKSLHAHCRGYSFQCQQAKRCLPLYKYLISLCAWGFLNCEPETMSDISFDFLNYSVWMATPNLSFGSSPTSESERYVTWFLGQSKTANRCQAFMLHELAYDRWWKRLWKAVLCGSNCRLQYWLTANCVTLLT